MLRDNAKERDVATVATAEGAGADRYRALLGGVKFVNREGTDRLPD